MLVKKCGFKKILKAQGELPRIERLDVHHHIREKEQRKEKRKRKNYGEFPVFKVTIYGAG